MIDLPRIGDNRRLRAGAHALSLVAAPLTVVVLQELAERPRPLAELRREAGFPPETTMRAQLRALSDVGIVTRRRRSDFPGALDLELREAGRELLKVVEATRSWLMAVPDGPIPLGSPAAKNAIKAFVEGWSTNMLRALAAKPLSLTELDSLISGVSYPYLERRLTAMRLAGQIEPVPSPGRGTPYAASAWLRRAVAPLVAAIRWERQYLSNMGQMTSSDIEATFLLAVPLINVTERLSGICRFAVTLRGSDESRIAGVTVGVEEGRIVACTSRLEGDAAAWASGSAPAWLSAVMEHDTKVLEVGGDCRLAHALIEALHDELFGTHVRR